MKGSGWQLFNFMFFNNTARCNVDLTGENIQTVTYDLTRNDLLKSLQNMSSVQPVEVFPQTITIKTGRVGEYAVPVKSLVEIRPREGFDIIGDVVIKPDIIVIKGDNKIVSNITQWYTKHVVLNNVYEPIEVQIPLSDTLSNIIRLSQQYVTLSANVEQVAETTIPDIKVNIRGGTLPANHRITPEQVTVTIRGGVEEISSLLPENVTATLEYWDLINDSTGIFVPRISLPDNLKVIQINPPYVYHVKVQQP